MYSNLLCEAGLTLGWLLCAQETLSETIFSLRKSLKEVIDVRIVAKTRNEVAIASCRPMPPFVAKWMARINQLYRLEQQALTKPLRGPAAAFITGVRTEADLLIGRRAREWSKEEFACRSLHWVPPCSDKSSIVTRRPCAVMPITADEVEFWSRPPHLVLRLSCSKPVMLLVADCFRAEISDVTSLPDDEPWCQEPFFKQCLPSDTSKHDAVLQESCTAVLKSPTSSVYTRRD